MSKYWAIILLCPSVLLALPEDRGQPIHVSAQQVLIDEPGGVSHYSGEAEVTQGSLLLKAETIDVFSRQRQVDKVIAVGDKDQLAHYQQAQPEQTRFIQAQAQTITYLIDRQLVKLKGKAHLIQGFDSFSGGSLDYDIKQDKVLLKRSETDDAQRVRFKIKL